MQTIVTVPALTLYASESSGSPQARRSVCLLACLLFVFSGSHDLMFQIDDSELVQQGLGRKESGWLFARRVLL